ncbi:MAG TPA: DUF2283 domain-containing protein [Thermoanaerobaculia bacterium]|jgi:uncharacterized protein YuzE
MKVHYFEDSDSVMMTFREGAKYDNSEEIAEGFVVDFDEAGRPMGLDIEDASKVFNIDWLRQHAYEKEELKTGSMIRDAPLKDEN